MIWTFASLIIGNYYVNDIQAILVSTKEDTINTFEDLINRRDVSLIMTKGFHHIIKDFVDIVSNNSFYLLKKLLLCFTGESKNES